MQIKKVAVLGAGAVGSYVIWGLSQRNDISLGVVAENDSARVKAILGAGVGCYTDSGHMKAIIDMFSGALIRMGKEHIK